MLGRGAHLCFEFTMLRVSCLLEDFGFRDLGFGFRMNHDERRGDMLGRGAQDALHDVALHPKPTLSVTLTITLTPLTLSLTLARAATAAPAINPHDKTNPTYDSGFGCTMMSGVVMCLGVERRMPSMMLP